MKLMIRRTLPALGCAAALLAVTPAVGAATAAAPRPAVPQPAVPQPAVPPRAAPALRAELVMPDAPVHSSAVLSYSDAVTLVGARNTPVLANLTLVRAAGDANTGFLRQVMLGNARLTSGVALTLTPAGSTRPEIKITLGRVTVAGDVLAGANGAVPTETVTFHFELFGYEVFTPSGHGAFTDAQSCWSTVAARQQCPSPVN